MLPSGPYDLLIAGSGRGLSSSLLEKPLGTHRRKEKSAIFVASHDMYEKLAVGLFSLLHYRRDHSEPTWGRQKVAT